MGADSNPVREVVVNNDHRGQRIDNFLMRELGQVPRSLVYRLIRTGQVRINGGRVKPMRKLAAGDRVRIPPIHNRGAAGTSVPSRVVERVAGRIIYRDEALLVVDKPAGLAAQGGSGLAWGLNDVVTRIEPRAVPVHRLDRGTSGLMVFALGPANARALQARFRSGEVEKRYQALLDGHLDAERVEVDEPLLKIRDPSGQHRVVVDPAGRPARSRFVRLERLACHDFVEADIETGRMHQIRAHALFLGAPIAGDDRYNPQQPPAGLKRMFLHAGFLRLPMPDGEQVFTSPLPDELDRVLRDLQPPE